MSPAAISPPSPSSACAWEGHSSSRARPASARPKSPRFWPRPSAASSSASRVGYPDASCELEIVRARRPKAAEALAREVVLFVQALRGIDLYKAPGVAETLDWVTALHELDSLTLDPQTVNDTLGVLLKYQDDISRMQGSEAKRILDQIKDEIRTMAAG